MKKAIVLGMIAVFLASCSNLVQATEITSYQLPASVEITFNALLPANSPVGEAILFTILDEVTGLEFNPQRMEMQSSGENSASITISVPAGTLLKYRYTRVSAAGNVDEVGANGEGIVYRAYLVDGPGHVAHDMVAAWADLPLAIETGRVSGTVSDAGSGLPLADFVVIAAGQQTRTDAEGRFLIPGLPQGLHNILIYSPSGSHLPFQQGALVAANSETPAAIPLTPNLMASVTFWLTPPADHTANTPVFLAGNVEPFGTRPLLTAQPDGHYSLTMQVPTGVDIRYKYTLGDGFWNAEHAASGAFQLRQLIIPVGTTSMEIYDQVESWSSGSSAPIMFDLTAPDTGSLVYIQFKLLDWTTPLPMWPLGSGRWAYKLYSPTNFSAALEYRYCLDAACTILEASPAQPRSVSGNKDELQSIEDRVDSWQNQ
ncbi:MAG: hypothetical protein M1347_01505 [Chloroflexi bacterium]|nr:hypothetical protein [Chloroflexota bacterium]